jgi:hypothetical protein
LTMMCLGVVVFVFPKHMFPESHCTSWISGLQFSSNLEAFWLLFLQVHFLATTLHW